MRRWFVVVLSSLLLSCSTKVTYNGEVLVRQRPDHKYEIEFRKHIEGRGNVHQLTLSKYELDESEWLYVDRLEGTVPAHDLIFTPYWGCLESPWSVRGVMGHVTFSGQRLEMSLQLPTYEKGETPSGYEPWRANGTYTIRFEDKPRLPKETDAPCNRK